MAAPADLCLTALDKMASAMEAIVEDAKGAAVDRGRFAEEAKAAHADTRSAVARLDGRFTELSDRVGSSHVETARAVGSSEAAVAALREEARFTRRLVYAAMTVGGLTIVGFAASMTMAVLTLKGLDGAGIVKDAAQIVQPTVDRGTPTEGASDARHQ